MAWFIQLKRPSASVMNIRSLAVSMKVRNFSSDSRRFRSDSLRSVMLLTMFCRIPFFISTMLALISTSIGSPLLRLNRVS
jgi:hypothetical protein